jgi:hypothetical protein
MKIFFWITSFVCAVTALGIGFIAFDNSPPTQYDMRKDIPQEQFKP